MVITINKSKLRIREIETYIYVLYHKFSDLWYIGVFRGNSFLVSRNNVIRRENWNLKRNQTSVFLNIIYFIET
jgi:hypothetical protein